jgi:hypothetical protein
MLGKFRTLMTTSIQVHRIRFYSHPVSTRFPFRYGIAAMTNLPHLFLRAEVSVGGKIVEGISSDGLAPKWFEKNPATKFEEDDLPRMHRVIANASRIACQLPESKNLFTFWRQLYDAQISWAKTEGFGGLIANLGTSLVERAVLDAMCRATGRTIFQLLRDNVCGIELGDVRAELAGMKPSDALASAPFESVALRHTVGLGDPLDASDAMERPDDDLPFTLEENIRTYGLSYFKIKICGKTDSDLARLRRIAAIIGREVRGAKFTLDGNEQFHDIASFRAAWETFLADAAVAAFLKRRLIFVEQPLHRDHALDESVRSELASWPDAPVMIIDEADADLSSLPRALDLGYRGTSHKNCKGIVKGIANAALLKKRAGILSGEDLANIGPCALLQDLAMMSAFGIEHVERNGHHYFKGLSPFPQAINDAVLRDHGDLYRRHPAGFAALAPRDGRIKLGSVNVAPFGLKSLPDWTVFGEIDLAPA